MPAITLTTDFGESDHFVAVMKGVILGIAPRAAVVDISHQVTPFQVPEAAFLVTEAHRYFPKGTIHVVVVDPGVGTSRRAILVQAAGQYFVGPDNGVLSMILARYPAKVRALTNEEYFRQPVSRTFHGRDIFAPVAAHLARGVKPSMFGKTIEDALRSPLAQPVRMSKHVWAGTVLKTDRFGNLITNYHVDSFPEVLTRPISMLVGITAVERVVENYEECPRGEVAVIAGSSGFLEVVSNQGSAAKILGCAPGSPLELQIF